MSDTRHTVQAEIYQVGINRCVDLPPAVSEARTARVLQILADRAVDAVDRDDPAG